MTGALQLDNDALVGAQGQTGQRFLALAVEVGGDGDLPFPALWAGTS